MLATADTAQLERSRRARAGSSPPVDAAPPLPAATGEIAPAPPREPSAATTTPRDSEPSILVSDLASVHAAVAASLDKPIAPPPSDAATPAREHVVAEVRKDAVAFSETEEAFFRRAEPTHPIPIAKPESFDDLDEGYEPPKFWDRVFGRRRKRPSSTSLPPIKPTTAKPPSKK